MPSIRDWNPPYRESIRANAIDRSVEIGNADTNDIVRCAVRLFAPKPVDTPENSALNGSALPASLNRCSKRQAHSVTSPSSIRISRSTCRISAWISSSGRGGTYL